MYRVVLSLIAIVSSWLVVVDSHVVADGPESVSAPTPKLSVSNERRSVPIVGEVRDGWQQTIVLPDTSISTGDRLVLAVTGGWLRVRRESSNGQWDWQFVLCQVKDKTKPTIDVCDGQPFVEVSYGDGRYFVRESVNLLRVLRQQGAPSAALISNDARGSNAKACGFAQSSVLNVVCKSWQEDGWYFVAHGPREGSWNAIVRLNPTELVHNGYGVSVVNAGHIHHFHGECWLIDDGELLVALRTLPATYERQMKREAARKAIIAGDRLPVIDATIWLNATDIPNWDSLKGKVVLLEFWGTWCGPCVAKLPETQSLHDKFAGRGLTVIGVHSQQGGDECAKFISEHNYMFPIAIDSGQTAEAYAIDAWPTYFLVDRFGKVVEAFTHNPPAEATIEKLLDQSATD